MLGMMNQVKECQKQGEHVIISHSVFHWTEKFIWEGKKDEMEIEEEKRIYMPITFSTIVQQHSSDAIYFPTLLSDDPITCTCQQKENLNAIRHDKGLANQ